MRKRTIAFLGLNLLVCASLLTACGKDEAEQTPSEVPTVVPTEPGDNPSVPQPTPTEPGTVVPTAPTEEGYTIEIGGVSIKLTLSTKDPENYLAAYVASNIEVKANETVVVKKDGSLITNLRSDSDENNIMSSTTGMVILQDATSDITLKLWVDGSYSLLITFHPAVTGYYENYVLDNDRTYTGYLVDGVPHGEGTLTWVNTNCVYIGEFVNGLYEGEGAFYWNNLGDKLIGTFDNGYPVTGRYTYSNTMSYTGEFNSEWKFHGEGSFDWNTYNADGSVKSYGWLYEGEFNNGTMAGCVGKVTFTAHRDGSNGEGLLWFEGEMDGFPNIKKGQQGKGSIRFSDNSIYEGDLLYQQDGAWIRYGEGIQYFYTSSNYTGASVGGNIDDLLYCYKGQFDALNHMYIYGNGVMYICDKQLNPVAYIKGCWDATTRTHEWLPQLGEWSDDMLLPGYENVEEIEFVHGYYATLKGLIDRYKDTDLSNKTLLVGHSHFTMWYESAAIDLAPEFDAINFGIGGSNAYFWYSNIDLFKQLKSAPKHIFIHMYGNIAHGDAVENQTHIQNVITKLHEIFPTTEIVCVSAFNTVVYHGTWQIDYTNYTNNVMKEWIENNDIENDRFIYASGFVYDENATSGKYYVDGFGYLRTDIWLSDNLHLNVEGHKLFAAAIKEAMYGEVEDDGNTDVTNNLFPKQDLADGTYNDLVLTETMKYNGSIVGGLAHGEGTITWLDSGDTLTATWVNGIPTTGNYLYANGCEYIGEFNELWLFEGNGQFTWPSGWKFEGTFENGSATYGKTTTSKTSGLIWYEGAMNGLNNIDSAQLGTGKYVYENTMSYEGQMYAIGALEGCTFHGQGKFDWNMYNPDGSVQSYGWLYEGEFNNGTMVGCVGKLTFVRQDPNAVGIHWFEGLMSEFPGVQKNQTGIGKIVLSDGTSYEGEVYYSANGEWIIPQNN